MHHRPGMGPRDERHPTLASMGRTKRLLLRELEIRRGRLVCPGCERALEPSRFTKHHIRPRSQGGPTSLDNLVLICRACHDEIHREPRGETRARVKRFLQERAAPGAFPPPPEDAPIEEGIRLFLVRAGQQLLRAVAHERYRSNPPFDPHWPVGRHFSGQGDWGVVRFVHEAGRV